MKFLTALKNYGEHANAFNLQVVEELTVIYIGETFLSVISPSLKRLNVSTATYSQLRLYDMNCPALEHMSLHVKSFSLDSPFETPLKSVEVDITYEETVLHKLSTMFQSIDHLILSNRGYVTRPTLSRVASQTPCLKIMEIKYQHLREPDRAMLVSAVCSSPSLL